MINASYEDILKSARPIKLEKRIIRPSPGSLAAPITTPEIIIPPLNSDIRFSAYIPTSKVRAVPGLAAALKEVEIPENFCWGKFDKNDSLEIKKKKELITPVPNQMLCGSCWAISTAGIVSDNFVVRGLVDYIPNISTTWALSCYPQSRCRGGNAALLFKDIERKGITSNNCVDYSWCSKNPSCNGSGTGHFGADVSSIIPSCGCYNNGVFPLYKITGVYNVYVNDENPEFDRLTIKRHILINGPIMGGYVVFKNFMNGLFTNPNINDGVYFENGIYDGKSVRFDNNQTTPDKIAGAHAVSVIGWGIAKNCIIDNNGSIANVPYWYCRNSWGSKWGLDGGYFKIAMHPYNKLAQFDKLVRVGNFQVGGFVKCLAVNPPELVEFEQINNYRGEFENQSEFYKGNVKIGPIPKYNDTDSQTLINNRPLLAVIIILVSIFIISSVKKR